MSAEKILSENWSDYDNRKIRDSRDSRYFSCEESWEVEYLVKYIKKHYPFHTTDQILTAIQSCCRIIPAPRPRKTFVECVISRL